MSDDYKFLPGVGHDIPIPCEGPEAHRRLYGRIQTCSRSGTGAHVVRQRLVSRSSNPGIQKAVGALMSPPLDAKSSMVSVRHPTRKKKRVEAKAFRPSFLHIGRHDLERG